ncbi:MULTISPECIES: hypothetical protein [unclassified Rhizobium]|uniref:hypothetical protein n=1 Tax=unclassified Rhizobium TaxID=2613769 RepID=UPI0010D75F66|nr:MULTISPECIES: hypothetical protein [unclassified Rhizobium]MBB3396432.1 hypothetical protein [Rhizobium sp. BK060]MBB4170179.1 hypothetical protein [Rhizobium sp. BK538]TCM76327.1 hypothetical protein EV291_110120 [Rhizobium sp. BK068]
MSALAQFAPSDRMLALMVAIFTVATLLIATEAHAFCSLACMHADHMAGIEICSSRASD